MAKWCGKIGFGTQVETAPSVWQSVIGCEKQYQGDILSNRLRVQSTGNVNPDMVISNRISIICDAFLNDHRGDIKYVIFRGVKCSVTDIEDQYPRLILNLGGVYNECC